jgi:hypothetical protein
MLCVTETYEVWQEPKSRQSDHDRDDAFEEQKPLPRMQTSNVIHVREDGCRQQPRKYIRDNISCMPNRHPEGTLLFGIPTRCHERDDGKERAFCEANEESTEHEVPWLCGGGHTNGNGGPGEHNARHPYSWLLLGHDNVCRNLRDNIAYVEQRYSCRPLNVGHMEIFLHACEARVRNIDSVQVTTACQLNRFIQENCGISLHQQHQSNDEQKFPVQFLQHRLV